jgi:hypothetical protein
MVRMMVDRREAGYYILIPEDDPDEEIHLPSRILKGLEEGDIIELAYTKDETAAREARNRIRETIVHLENRSG